MTSLTISSAADVTLKATDAPGTSSFTGSTNWSDGNSPAAGNAYFTGAFAIRTTNYVNNGGSVTVAFAGDSLSIDPGGRMLGKIGNNGTAGSASTGTMIGNFILNGGTMDEAAGVNGNDVLVVSGTVTVSASSLLGASGATGNNNANFETLEITAPISGSAALQVSGTNVNGGADTGTVKLSAANPYSGTITVPNSRANAVIASAVNRILQLNNLDALSNATLNLTSTNINPVSFASAVNTAPFNIGALSGGSSQALSDTAGNAVALSVGGINASSAYSGALTGNGSLTKVGTGTLTLSGANTYTGNTTISNGTLVLNSGGAISSANIIVAPGATFDVTSNAFTLASGQNLFGGGTVMGPVTVASGANVYGDAGMSYGTNTFTTNVTILTGGQVNLNLGTAYNGANDMMVVGGNLDLNSTTFYLNAPGTSANLDQTADYTLATVGGTITGSPVLVWGVAPANSAHYSIKQSGNNLVLHYNASLVPAGNGAVTPNPAARNQPVLITVTVTFNSNPINSVTVDASQLGGSSSLALVAAGGGVYTNSVAVAPGLAAGTATLIATMTDSVGNVGTTPPFTVAINTSSETWDGLGSDNAWSTNPNWQSGSAPGYIGDSLTFAGTTQLSPNMNGNYTITSLTFDGSAGAFVLNSESGDLLTLTGGIANNSPNPQTLNLSMANMGNLIDFSGGNNIVVNGGISGAGGLQNDDSATVVLAGTNSFAGGININSGTLQIAGAGMLGGTNAMYGGAITNNGGVLQYSSSATQTVSGVVSSYGSVMKDGPGKLILAGNNTYYASTIISNGVLQVSGTLANDIGNDYVYDITDDGTLEMSSSGSQTLAGNISGSGGLIQDGSGTLNITGNSSYSGGTIVNSGVLEYSPDTVGYSSSVGSLVINSGGTIEINANNGASLPAGDLTLTTNGTLDLSYNFSGGNPTVAAIALTGNLSSPGTNIIRISSYGAALGQFPLISYTTLSADLNNFVLSLPAGVSGALVNDSANHTLDLNVTAVSPANWVPLIANDAVGTSSFTNSANWQNNSAPAAGNGYYTQGYVLRSPADTNNFTFGGSALSIDPYGFAGNVGGRLLLKAAGNATITITNLILNGGLVDYADAANNGIKTLAGNVQLNNGTKSFMGALAGPGYSETLIVAAPINGNGSLQIGGNNVNAGADTGVVEMDGTNTYTGGTTVATGTLFVNGSVSNSAFTVLTNATLGGVGSIGGAVAVQSGAMLAPGISASGALSNALGTLTIGGAVSVSGTLAMSINRGASPNSDELSLPAGITVNPGATLSINNIGPTNLAAGDTFKLFSAPISGAFSATNLPALPNSGLAWTNKLALDGTIAVVSTAAGPGGPEALTNTFNAAAGTLNLSWPPNEGWRLQVQTNSLSRGIGSNWVYLTDGTISSTNISVDRTNGSVFYRLTYP